VGYTGGVEKNPTYACIKDATEAILMEYDPSVISYNEILKEWSEQLHDPQYPQSKQYRSAIWVKNESERTCAMDQIRRMTTMMTATTRQQQPRKLYVDVEDVGSFYQAEDYHQDYLRKHTGGTGYF
jgi:peptide-methionine (S)-S-oxide reductase